MRKRQTWIVRDDSTGGPRYFTGDAQMLFPFPLFDMRRKFALQYIDERMAKIKAQDLRESGHKILVEEY